MLFICYPKCSTCQKALKWLDEHKIPYEFRDIKEDRPTREELIAWQAKSDLPLKRFFNTSGQLYRENGLAARLPEMTEAGQFDLLSSDGMMVKRPILVDDDFVLVGFREKEWAERLI
ncbi:MAG: arsenate reductase family protein [Clostridiaceae bacterium]|nr:arsenate reductase family protein [Clostridiaceae bacterium]